MKKKTIVLIALPIGLALVIVAAGIVFVLSIIWQGFYWQGVIGLSIEKQLGFSHGSPYVRSGNRTEEVFTFEDVSTNGIIGRAGVSNGVIPISLGGETDLSFTKFYKILHTYRGQEIELKVVPGGDGPEISSRPVQVVKFKIPEK